MRHFILGLFTAALMGTAFVIYNPDLVAEAQTSPRLKLGDPLPANLFVELSKAVNPSVVNISTAYLPQARNRFGGPQRPGMRDPFFDFFEQFMGPQMPAQPQQALGTGFIIRKDGLILTNNHVIEGADVVKVQLAENDTALYEADVIGHDQRTDIALIKIDAKKDLPVAVLGKSSDLQVGEWVAAFGNPFGHGHTVTKGIVSALGREIDEINKFSFIQTDASINPGNSGGPLVNARGEVVGVNAAIDARAQGIGFAIPIDDVKSVLGPLEKNGVIERAFFGVNMYPYPIDPRNARELGLNTTNGALIVGVLPGSPAQKAGLREYDFIVKFDGAAVDSSATLQRVVQDRSPGKTYKVEYLRNGKKRTAKVTLAVNPQDKNVRQTKARTYRGQKAPFNLGFSVQNYSSDLAKQMKLPKIKRGGPVVVDIETGSPAAKAGLGVGDIIMDVNRETVHSETDVLKKLKKDTINSLRVLRGGYPVLIMLNPKL